MHFGALLLGVVFAVVLVWRWRRKPEHRMFLAGLTALFGTNLVLLDRGVPLGGRLIPSIGAMCAAAIVFVGWQRWRGARAKT